MSSLFAAPKAPKIQPAPPPPQVDEAAKAAEEEARLSRRRGRAASILTGEQGVTTPLGNVGKSTLLGG